jgi:tight adherence protein B
MMLAAVCLALAALVARQAGAAPARRGQDPPGPSSSVRLARGAGRRLQRFLGRRTRPHASVSALCQAIVAELEAGAPPDLALQRLPSAVDLVPRGRTAALLGEPVAPALAADAAAAGSTALAGLAACWRAAEQSGARLAGGLEQVAATARAEEALARDLRTELAAPIATAKVLLLLPVAGLILGELLGARPVAWLLGSPAGLLCALLGLLLIAAGRVWSMRIIAAALPDGVAPGSRGR